MSNSGAAGDDQVGRRELALGLDVLPEVVEAGRRPVGRLDRGDRAVLLDVRHVIGVLIPDPAGAHHWPFVSPNTRTPWVFICSMGQIRSE